MDMKFKMVHQNFNVADLDKAIEFYDKALGFKVTRKMPAADGSYIIAFVGNEETDFGLELTWLRDHPQKYNLGECEFHLAVRVDDIEAARAYHRELGCICYENTKLGVYFIMDPDGYWIEVVPNRNKK